MVVFLPLLLAIVGLLVYAISVNPKAQEIGRITYFAGLLAWLLTGAQHLVNVLR
jgi:hypothetical protein